MYINGSYMLLAALLLFFFDICLIVYAMIYRRYAIVPMSRISFFASVAASLAMTLICIYIITRQSEIMSHSNAPLVILMWSLCTTLAFVWMVILLYRSDRTARDLIETLVGITEASAPNLNGNAVYIRLLSRLLYRHMPLDVKLKINPNELYYAALLIDVGQLGIPRELREKWGKLTSQERALMNKSPDIASQLLSQSKSFERIAEWIRLSGERIDGGGRLGLKGDEIPTEAKILALTSTYAAITLSRTYKALRSCNEAMKELRLVAGTQLDEELVDIFTGIPVEEAEECLRYVRDNTDRMRNIGIGKGEAVS